MDHVMATKAGRLKMLHDLFGLFIALLCIAAIISPRVPTGVIGSISLGGVAIAALWSMDDAADLGLIADILLICAGMLAAQVSWLLFLQHRKPTWQDTHSQIEHARESGP
jgi:hypothetical protein